MKKLRSFDPNLIDLIMDAHRWQYSEINDNKDKSLAKKPRFYFTKTQWFLVGLSMGIVIMCPNSLSVDFAGYIISGLSLFVGLLFTIVVSLFDKFCNIDFTKYNKRVNMDLYKIGVRLKNFFKKSIILTLYTAILAIVSILMLSIDILFEMMQKDFDVFEIICNYHKYSCLSLLKLAIIVAHRVILFYFLLNFIYITKQLITSFYDYMISEISNVKLN